MVQNKIFCDVCGYEISITKDKSFFFCPECGNKIIVKKKEEKVTTEISANYEKIDAVTEKLKEVEFYYNLSFDKKEYEDTTRNPTYYLKAQDLLVDLSTQFPDDYRVWWELCKPIDYLCSLSSPDVQNRYSINEDFFDKALDRAELSKKRELIDKHDEYTQNKEKIRLVAEKQFLEEERKRKEAETAEKIALEKKRQEEKNKRREAEKAEKLALEKKRQEEEKIRKQQELEEQNKREAIPRMSEDLWKRLKNKDFSDIDNKYFSFSLENNQSIVAVFKNMSNIMYLNTFRIDGNKANTVYKDQSIAIQFDENGRGFKFDKTPVKIKGFMPPDNTLRIYIESESLYVNGFPVKLDDEYTKNLAATSKKSLLSFSKIFN